MVMFKLNASGPPSFLLAFALAFLVERTNLFFATKTLRNSFKAVGCCGCEFHVPKKRKI